jgi:hypothetical protein
VIANAQALRGKIGYSNDERHAQEEQDVRLPKQPPTLTTFMVENGVHYAVHKARTISRCDEGFWKANEQRKCCVSFLNLSRYLAASTTEYRLHLESAVEDMLPVTSRLNDGFIPESTNWRYLRRAYNLKTFETFDMIELS